METSADRDTVVWVHEYWSDAYGIEAPVHLDAELIDVDGRTVRHWGIYLDEGETFPISIREACRRAAIPQDFAGHLLLRHTHESLVAGRPVQVFGEYRSDTGDASGVHGQYGIIERPLAQAIAALRVEAGPDRRSGVVIVNTLAPDASREAVISPVVEIFNSRGERRRKRLGSLAHRAAAKIYFDDLLPGLSEFLGGRPGHARVVLPGPASRLLGFVEQTGRPTIVNHGTVDRTFDQASGVPVGWDRSRPIASLVVWMGPERETVLTVPNRFGPCEGDYDLSLTMRAADGTHAGETSRAVVRRGITEINLSAMVRELAPHLAEQAAVHVEVEVTPADHRLEAPAHLDLLLGIFERGRLVAEMLAGGGFFNEEIPSDLPWPDIRRTRIFTRVRTDPGARTLVFLANPSGDRDYTVTAAPQVRLLDRDGAEIASKDLEIPPHGAVLIDVADMLEPGAVLPDGFGTLKVRDKTARLYGYCLVERDGADAIPFDHLVGG